MDVLTTVPLLLGIASIVSLVGISPCESRVNAADNNETFAGGTIAATKRNTRMVFVADVSLVYPTH
jgi:hypothetical protein